MTGSLHQPGILVVDDDAATRGLLRRLLWELGYGRVFLCEGGQEAFTRLRGDVRRPVDIIFLDVDMPQMDGVEVIRQLAVDHFAGHLVLSSGHGERLLESIRRLIVSHGLRSSGILQKPVRRDALRALMAGMVHGAPREPSHGVPVDGYSEADLRRAIADGELVTWFQPQVSLRDGAVVGAEVLVRWRHPHDGLVLPATFIPLAAASGLLPAVTRCVMASSLAEAARWQKRGYRLRLSLNVSMLDVAEIGFADEMAGIAQQAGVDPASLTLEVTEDQVMSRLSAVLDVLARLSLKRFRLSIDDFGTGHSSLAQLRDLPFDELKIDRTFVHGATLDSRLNAICAASIQMAHELDMTVVAEGIEDQADWDALHRLGCDIGQGYHIARPLPAAGLRDWLVRRAAHDPRHGREE